MQKPNERTTGLIGRIERLDAHYRLYIALAVAAIILAISWGRVSSHPISLMASWIAYCGCSLALVGVTIFSARPADVRRIAQKQDSSRALVFVFIVGAALVSLLGVIILLENAPGLSKRAAHLHILLSTACVVCSWVLVHTIFTLRYAHFYYAGIPASAGEEAEAPYGLEFPGETDPDYLDFAYFSFVIGMTFQVSDVSIKSRGLRRLNLLHSLISFVFNTVIVALVINVILGAVQK